MFEGEVAHRLMRPLRLSLLVLKALTLNRLAGIDYPLWSKHKSLAGPFK